VYKKAKAGDLICCNFTNMLEVLYLARRSSPAYGLPTKDGNVVIVSLPRMMAACIWNPQSVIQGRKVLRWTNMLLRRVCSFQRG
jgi:hypothetical protein